MVKSIFTLGSKMKIKYAIVLTVSSLLFLTGCNDSQVDTANESYEASQMPEQSSFIWDKEKLFLAMLNQDLIVSWGYPGDYIKTSVADQFTVDSQDLVSPAGSTITPTECKTLDNLITPSEELDAENYSFIENSNTFDQMFIQWTFSFATEEKAKLIFDTIKNSTSNCGSYKKLRASDGTVLDKVFWNQLEKNESNLLISDIPDDQGIAIGRNGTVIWTVFIIDSNKANIAKTLDLASMEIENNLNKVKGM